MTLGGRRVEVSRPRVRTADDERELPVETYEYFADRDPLTRGGDEPDARGRVHAQVRRRGRAGRRGGRAGSRARRARARCRSCSSSGPATALWELMGRRLEDVRLAVMMLDGIEIADRTHVVALGITHRGREDPAGAVGGLDRERDAGPLAAGRPGRPGPGSRAGDPVRHRRREGPAATRSRTCSASTRSVHRCHRHKERNVTDLLPERDRPQSWSGSAARGRSRTPTSRRSGSSGSPQSSSAPGPTPPPRCARG